MKPTMHRLLVRLAKGDQLNPMGMPLWGRGAPTWACEAAVAEGYAQVSANGWLVLTTKGRTFLRDNPAPAKRKYRTVADEAAALVATVTGLKAAGCVVIDVAQERTPQDKARALRAACRGENR